MPFIAELNGSSIESWTLSVDEWSLLKQAYRSSTLLLSCGTPGIPKTSQYGLQFFAHKAGADCALHVSADESQEHLAAKMIVAEAARAAGWAATVEHPAPDRTWIADVLVERGDLRVAVEVQLSAQTSAEFQRRQLRYEAAGIKCVWLLGPRNYRREREVPNFRIIPELGAQTINVQTGLFYDFDWPPLAEGIEVIFDGSLAAWIDPLVTYARIATRKKRCYRKECARWLTFWYLESVDLETRCGLTARFSSESYSPWLSQRVEQVIQKEVRRRIGQSDLPTPTIFNSRQTARVPDGYMGQICPYCQRVQGDYFIGEEHFKDLYDLEVNRLGFPLGQELLQCLHRCKDIGRGRCEHRYFPEPSFPNPANPPALYASPIDAARRPLPARRKRLG